MLLFSKKEQQTKEEGTTIIDKIQLSPISSKVSLSTSSFITSFVSFGKIFILNKTAGLHLTFYFYWVKWKSSSHSTSKEKRGKMMKWNKKKSFKDTFFQDFGKELKLQESNKTFYRLGHVALHLMLSKTHRAEWLSEINLNHWLIVILRNH